MAVYKVPQDVEADDKLVGPFSFRQFIYLLIVVGSLYIGYLFFRVAPFLVIIPLPITIFFAALAFPWKKDQPTEVYLTALIHFWTKPRRRIWDNDGVHEHVKITAPKQEEIHYSDGLNNQQVNTRLASLASTLDSRGWAAKNVTVQDARAMNQFSAQTAGPTQVAMPQVIAPAPQVAGVGVEEDVLDYDNNPVAQNFDQLVTKAAEDHRQELMDKMQNQIANPTTTTSNDQTADATQAQFNPYPDMNQRVVQPAGAVGDGDQPSTSGDGSQKSTDDTPSDAIINLASNSDLNVSTIARQAEAALHDDETIELH